MKWEYSFCRVNELPMMGEAGWEAYAVLKTEDTGQGNKVYLKRPAESQSLTPPSIPPVAAPPADATGAPDA